MKRVLVAEDETSIREFIVINLQRSGYEVSQADNGRAALEAYEAADGDFDVVLLDIMMPEMDGLEVCKRLRSMSQTVGIIMLTAKTQEIDRVTGLLVGADDYVSKPFSPSELMARVDAIYRRVEMNKNREEPQKSVVELGEFVLNLRDHTLTKNGVNIELTHRQWHRPYPQAD